MRAMKLSSTLPSFAPPQVLHRRCWRRSRWCRCSCGGGAPAAHRARARRLRRPARRAGSRDRRPAMRRPARTKSRHHCQSLASRSRHRPAVLRTSSYSASGTKPPPSATVTRCCTSTSSGCSRRAARLDAARPRPRARAAAAFDQLEAVRRHQRDARRPARRMARAARALQQPRDALGRADLQHALDRQEVDAQVQARRADHGLAAAVLQAQLHPLAHLAVERAVVQRDHAGPVGPRLQQRLVPDLGLRARVGEDQRGGCWRRSPRSPAAAS